MKAAPPAPSPFAPLNAYPDGLSPSTAAIGHLAETVQRMCGTNPLTALSASVLFDQGRAADALDLLAADMAAASAAREAAKEAARAKAGRA